MAKITIIDDDVGLAEDMRLMLQKEGHVVTIRDTTDGAVEALSGSIPDLLILDVMFPENRSAGFDLAREIRRTKTLAKLPVVLLTGVNQEYPMDFSSRDIDPDWMPVQAFVSKPVGMDTLLETVRRLLEGAH